MHAIQKGHLPLSAANGKAQETAKKMDPDDATDFAHTKHKGLPKRVKKSNLDCRSALRMAFALMQ